MSPPKTIVVHQEEEPTGWTPDERSALGLYAVASRDFTDFVDMLNESKTTVGALKVLHEMCATPGGPEGRDCELDALMVPFIERALKRRGETP